MKIFAGTLLAAMFAMASAHAQVVTFDFTAEVTQLSEYDGKDTPVSSIAVPGFEAVRGDIVHGQFSFDVSTPLSPIIVWTPEFNSRVYEGLQHPVLGAFTVERNGNTSSIDRAGFSSITVTDAPASHGGDALYFQSSAMTQDGLQGRWLALGFNDYSGNALAAKSIPGSLALSAFDHATFTFGWFGYSGNQYFNTRADATITSITQLATSPVPEPTTYAMFAVGLLALGGVARRKAAAQR